MRALYEMLVAGTVLIAAINTAAAQDMGDAKQGGIYAGQICSECHAVRPGVAKSPHAQVPSFQTIADSPGMTPTALRVWFQSAHRSMPNLVINEEDSDNVIAYILSLRKHN